MIASQTEVVRRVLVVENENDISSHLKVLFERHGCQVQVAEDAESAINALRASLYDIILSDLSLQVRHDGLDVIRFANSLEQDLSIIVTTGFFSSLAQEELGGITFHLLLKPFSRDEFEKLYKRIELEKMASTQLL